VQPGVDTYLMASGVPFLKARNSTLAAHLSAFCYCFNSVMEYGYASSSL